MPEKWIDTKIEVAGSSSWERGAMAWEAFISAKELAKNAGIAYINRIEIGQRGRSGRILSLKLIGDKTVNLESEYKIRQAFGNLYSSIFLLFPAATDWTRVLCKLRPKAPYK